jgi:5'-phosphate synthase pdxT subunit
MIIGVLGLQGAVREHMQALGRAGLEGRIVRRPEQLTDLAGLILPGGESTTISLLGEAGILDALRTRSREGFPLFGTCAGMILLASEIEGGGASRPRTQLGAIDITVSRNASGRQIDSFETTLIVRGIGEDVRAVFIRAPYITRVGQDAEVLATHRGVPVMARQGRVMVTSFHPELTDDPRIHRYFGGIAERYVKEVDTS